MSKKTLIKTEQTFLNRINNWINNHDGLFKAITLILTLIVSIVIAFFNNKISKIEEKIDKIEVNTALMKSHAGKSFENGVKVIVGVNEVDLKGNSAIVYVDNAQTLTMGDQIILENTQEYTGFKTNITLLVQQPRDKEKILPPKDDPKAVIYISPEAANRLGFVNHKKLGIAEFNMRIINKRPAPLENK